VREVVRGDTWRRSQANGFFPNVFWLKIATLYIADAPYAEHRRSANGGSFRNFEPLADC
jgi:hypothetical protein